MRILLNSFENGMWETMTNWDWGKGLSPIAREKLARIGELTPEEKEEMRVSEKVNSLLSEFYQGKIDPEACGRG